MIANSKSSAANYLAPITSGHGSPVRNLMSDPNSFSQLLSQSGVASKTERKGETLGLESLSGLGSRPTIHNMNESKLEVQSDFADNETTLNGKLPEEQPQTAEEALTQFVGETFYGMMIKQMRSSVIKSDLMGTSNAEKMFESQFDQMMVQRLAENSSSKMTEPMYKQMMLQSDPS